LNRSVKNKIEIAVISGKRKLMLDSLELNPENSPDDGNRLYPLFI